MTEPYGGTEDELNAELNIVAGLVNLHLMMTLQRGNHKMRKRFLGRGDGGSLSPFDKKVSEHVRYYKGCAPYLEFRRFRSCVVRAV